jgi:signal transduction histidine kinase
MSIDSAAPAPAQSQVSNWVVFIWVVAVSSVIGLLLTLMQGPEAPWDKELVASNCIGFSIWGVIRLVQVAGANRLARLPTLLISIPLGVVIGGKIATLFGVEDFIGVYVSHPVDSWKAICVIALLTVSASAYVVASSDAAKYRLGLEIERRRLAEAGRSQTVAELALLQAQIEPHFLFNTLAHVQSAIEQDPATGKQILELLIRYLRGTLHRTRNTYYTLAEERELIDALLNIASIRIGPRLRYQIDISEAIGNAVLPPLLLQPLVENAIKHGIEPSIDGGEIRVEGRRIDDVLVLRVTDSGLGMAEAGPEGVGLANVRARLASLYGTEGRLTLERNPTGGVIAELRLPGRWS